MGAIMSWVLFFLASFASAHPPTTLTSRDVCIATARAAGPDFELGRAEALVLSKADLRLTADMSIKEWEAELNKFFEAHRHDPDVQKWVGDFVLEFTNRQNGDYIPGDWAVQRKISDWRHFFLQQAGYYVKPAKGGAYELIPLSNQWAAPKGDNRYPTLDLLVKGTERQKVEGPDGKMKEIIPAIEIAPAGLYTSVVENTLASHYLLRKEVKGTATEEGKADLRRIYLQQTLLKEAYLRWKTELSVN